MKDNGLYLLDDQYDSDEFLEDQQEQPVESLYFLSFYLSIPTLYFVAVH